MMRIKYGEYDLEKHTHTHTHTHTQREREREKDREREKETERESELASEKKEREKTYVFGYGILTQPLVCPAAGSHCWGLELEQYLYPPFVASVSPGQHTSQSYTRLGSSPHFKHVFTVTSSPHCSRITALHLPLPPISISNA